MNSLSKILLAGGLVCLHCPLCEAKEKKDRFEEPPGSIETSIYLIPPDCSSTNELPNIRFAALIEHGNPYHNGFSVDVYSSHISVGSGQSGPSEITRQPLFIYPDGSTVLTMRFYHACASMSHYIRITDGYNYNKTIDLTQNGQQFEDTYIIGDKKNITIAISLCAY